MQAWKGRLSTHRRVALQHEPQVAIGLCFEEQTPQHLSQQAAQQLSLTHLRQRTLEHARRSPLRPAFYILNVDIQEEAFRGRFEGMCCFCTVWGFADSYAFAASRLAKPRTDVDGICRPGLFSRMLLMIVCACATAIFWGCVCRYVCDQCCGDAHWQFVYPP